MFRKICVYKKLALKKQQISYSLLKQTRNVNVVDTSCPKYSVIMILQSPPLLLDYDCLADTIKTFLVHYTIIDTHFLLL